MAAARRRQMLISCQSAGARGSGSYRAPDAASVASLTAATPRLCGPARSGLPLLRRASRHNPASRCGTGAGASRRAVHALVVQQVVRDEQPGDAGQQVLGETQRATLGLPLERSPAGWNRTVIGGGSRRTGAGGPRPWSPRCGRTASPPRSCRAATAAHRGSSPPPRGAVLRPPWRRPCRARWTKRRR